MRRRLGLAVVVALAAPAHAQPEADLERGFAGALRGCELWVLEPKSWSEGTARFVERVGLGDRMGMVEGVPAVALPPQALRAGNLYWRINSTQTAGYILVVSFQMPMCHITGGGDVDLQPLVEKVLASAAFAARWEKLGDDAPGEPREGMASTIYRSREDPKFSIQISRAPASGQPLDRVQVIATATLDLSADRGEVAPVPRG